MKVFAQVFDTHLGRLAIAVDEKQRLVDISFVDAHAERPLEGMLRRREIEVIWDDAPSQSVRQQIEEYCRGERKHFDVQLAERGTAFQERVWSALSQIPYGTTTTYGTLAQTLFADKRKCRAVGQAVGRNPWSIIVPCHRVVGSNQTLTGYAWGLERKRALLQLEGAL